MSPVVAEGQRVSGPAGLSVWLPSDWEFARDQLFEFIALGPPEEPYRANMSIHHVSVDESTPLEDIAQATAARQAEVLDTFVEYDRRTTDLAGDPAIQREYGWVQAGTGLVLYQIEVLALPAAAPGRMLEVHATSSAPAYFRYAAMLRRIVESIGRESEST